MGVGSIEIFDEDGVTEHNLPNQFYRKKDLDSFKVEALKDIIEDFSDTKVKIHKKFYTKEKLNEMVITCTDSLESRKIVWNQFLKQSKTKHFIDGRMGGELAHIFIIKSKDRKLIKFYEKTFKVNPVDLPCSERSIIYCVMMISSLICRAVKGIVKKERNFPKELIFGLTNMIYMDTK